MIRSLSPSLVTLGFLIALAAPAGAHKHPCGHTHAGGGNSVVTCNNQTQTCGAGGAGTCTSHQNRIRVWCNCDMPKGGGGGCMATAVNFFSDQESGLPTASSSIIYLAASNAENIASVNFGDVQGPEFGPETGALQGTFTLEFGSFGDPANVPVIVSDVSLSFPAVANEGMNWFELPDGAFQSMIYDSTTRTLESTDDGGIELWMSNTNDSQVSITVYLNAAIDAQGGLMGFVQMDVPANILFSDNFETGTTDDWSTAVGTMMEALFGRENEALDSGH